MLNGDDAKVDEKAAAEMVGYAMAHGVNYYDTAWVITAANRSLSLARLWRNIPGNVLSGGQVPGYDLSNMGKVRRSLKNS